MNLSYSAAIVAGITIGALGCTGCTPLGKSNVRSSVPAVHDINDDNPIGLRRAIIDDDLRLRLQKEAADRAEGLSRFSYQLPLSPGDKINLTIDNGEGFNGRYEIGIDGKLNLPQIDPVQVAGHSIEGATQKISVALVSAQIFRASQIRVSLSVYEWASIQINVAGAVFNPGYITINARPPEERRLKSEQITGDFPPERLLSSALISAGGVRPDAAIDNITIYRNAEIIRINLDGLLDGLPFAQIPLMSGDKVVVPSTGEFNRDLVGLSAITPPGVRVFLSNLTEPATGNAISAIGKEATSLPYGSRLLTGAISANCVGGVRSTSAARYAILVRTDPISGKEEVIERAIHELYETPDVDVVNPLLMPNDSIACYDSDVTNFRDILKLITQALTPFGIFF